MKPEKSRLIHELLADDEQQARRAVMLQTGRCALRHRRWRRRGIRVVMFMAVAALLALPVRYRLGHRPQQVSVVPASKPAVHYLTDQQLLALFPNTPVGLAKVGNRKVLIFPRESDRERFVGRF